MADDVILMKCEEIWYLAPLCEVAMQSNIQMVKVEEMWQHTSALSSLIQKLDPIKGLFHFWLCAASHLQTHTAVTLTKKHFFLLRPTTFLSTSRLYRKCLCIFEKSYSHLDILGTVLITDSQNLSRPTFRMHPVTRRKKRKTALTSSKEVIQILSLKALRHAHVRTKLSFSLFTFNLTSYTTKTFACII